MESIKFKSYPRFMDELRAGRNFDVRKFDTGDPRFQALSKFELRPWGSLYNVAEVTFISTDADDWLTFKYLGMTFCEHLPGWCVLKLGPVLRTSKLYAGGPQ